MIVFPSGYLCSEETPQAKLERVSIDYKDANIVSVLKAIAYSNDLNIVMTRDIKGTVSANMQDVSVDEALKGILSVNGYTYIREGKLIYIVPGQGVEGLGLNSVALHLNYLSAPEAKQILSKTISTHGDIQINEATNSLVVTDYKENVENIKNLLKEIDTPPIQVLIEAKILDIQSKAFENMGVTSSLTYDPKGSGGGGIFGRSTGAAESLAATTSMAGPSSTLTGGQMTITTVLKDINASVTIDALIQQNKAHLLASPSIATLNGKEARIIIGDRVPVKQTTTTQTGTSESTIFVDVGTTLRVTPQVSPDGWITMKVHPEVSSVTSTLAAGPNITTREADATIRVKDGQTIIIGGLISKQDDQITGGTPFLKSIPILGMLFSKRSKDQQEKQLTVFITPHIISFDNKPADNAAKIVLNQATGERNLIANLYEYAKNLNDEHSVESANRTLGQRQEAILNVYEMISNQFPNDREADFALLKSAQLYIEFRRYSDAVKALNALIAQYPDSVYRDPARKVLDQALIKQKERDDVIAKELLSNTHAN